MRRFPVVVFAITVICAVLFGSHYYIATRLIFESGVPDPWRGMLLTLLVVAAASLVASPVSERTLPPALSRWIVWPASVWMGVGFWLVLATAITDLGMFLLGALGVAEGVSDWDSISGLRAVAVVSIVVLASVVAIRSGLRPPRDVRIEIELAGWPSVLNGFRIVQITDIHIGPILDRRFARAIVDRVNALQPDLIAVTGDLVDGGVEQLAEEVAPFKDLKSRHGVYFVTGNHDHYSGVADWVAKATELGMRVLRNERVEICDSGAGFDLIGVDDHRGNMIADDGREDLHKAVAGRDTTRPAILLAHDPSTFRRASKMGIDLQISGHTHGGQIWPFGYFVRVAIPYVAGYYRVKESQLYVSRGTGFWGPPMRLFAPAEISEFVIRGPLNA